MYVTCQSQVLFDIYELKKDNALPLQYKIIDLTVLISS